MLHIVIYNYKINKDLEKSRQGKENENEFAYIYYLLTSRKVPERMKNGKISRHIQCIFKDVNSEYYNNYQRNYQKKRRKK